ncbi:type I polyketide synthase [Streptomyces sp. HUAS TT20]|uniref:type I polyketide synthase n=1 Tax=Streptomyces sp. HUAS TT20 TaxID=3447509 RepID=UPI0021D8EF48|nr:type I polyketide synthase [Streptomyces sp. HUAS 15-9]UXY30464.1 SDR family oxidoreductase [Streptomyces sp. HUAS 15-9]
MSDSTDDLSQVAIIGMAGRFPKAADVGAFWDNLAAGEECLSFFSEEELREQGVSPALLAQPGYVRAKGVLDGADTFDAGFFGLSPREAELMDPQHRVFLECTWEALESAGYDPQAFPGRIGVFAGASLNTYLLFNLLANRGVVETLGQYQTQLANDKDFLATRASYKLGLKGPGITVQTACSTSLVAVHLACQSLLSGECDIALAGGVSVNVPLRNGYLHQPGGILSPDGHCRPFDAAAGGTVIGNGVALVVLRRLADAREQGDLVDAVIRGSAVNNDGALKVGYTAPSVEGQAEVIAEALGIAGVSAETVGYVETHGTGTALGDPIEIAALTRAYREETEARGYCAIGSVKSNVGHLDAAAGATALIKATLALKNEAIPASLHFERPNPELRLESSPFFVNTTHRPWPRGEVPRRAGVSSFGIGGTNAHVVLEEGPAPRPGEPGRPWQLLTLSARTDQALAQAAERLADHLETDPGEELADVAFTLAARRRAFEQRRAVVCVDRADAVRRLRQAARAGEPCTAGRAAKVAFLFPGQGTQYPGMARQLYADEPVFRAELDRCLTLFDQHLDEDLRAALFPPPEEAEKAAERLEETALAQPALFAVEYALARTLMAWGLVPHAMAGHSIGEYVAACVAGVFTLEDATALVAARGRLMRATPHGAMLAVFLPEDETKALLDDDLCVAAVNATSLCVVAGPVQAVERLRERLASSGVGCRRLHTSHAFHSPLVEGAVHPFREEVRKIRLHPPRIPFSSNVSGTWIEDAQATDPEYWGTHLRSAVRFADNLSTLLADPDLLLLEVGPGQSLSNFARQHRSWTPDRVVAATLRQPREERPDRQVLLEAVGAMWSAGAQVDWEAQHDAGSRRRVRLPSYPFQRQRYWVDPGPADRAGQGSAEPGAAEPATWTYTPSWRRLPPPASWPLAASGPWLVLGTDLPLGRTLRQGLEAAGCTVVGVSAGDGFAREGERSFTVDPAGRDDFERLFAALGADDLRPARVLHLWSLAGEPAADPVPRRATFAPSRRPARTLAAPAEDPSTSSTGASGRHTESTHRTPLLHGQTLPAAALDRARLDSAQDAGFHSLLALAQALSERPPGQPPLALDVLTRGVFGVTGEELLQPENATVLGPCTVIPQEVPDVGCRLLDLSGQILAAPPETVLDALRAALAAPPAEHVLAWRGSHWWARTFDPVPLDAGEGEPDSGRLRDEGVYLITGGLGGIGLALAEHLARSVRAPAIGLLGRGTFPPEDAWPQWLAEHGADDPTSARIRRLEALRSLGARPVVLRADVTDAEQTSRAVEELRARFGALNGVVHAAGAPASGLLAGKSRADAETVLTAKTRGTLVLDTVCSRDPLDFFLLFSSRTAVVGGPGQVDYCAANAFLDAYAARRSAGGSAPVTAVAWDTWRDTGMAAGLHALPGADAGTGEDFGHPLLQRRLQRTESTEVFLTTIRTSDSWIVDEHRMQGHGLVPGTTYLEMVRAAVEPLAAGREIEFRDVLFHLPVIVPDGQERDLYTVLEDKDGDLSFRIRSHVPGAAQNWQEHATGSVLLHERSERAPREVAGLLEECGAEEVIEGEQALRRRLRLDFAAEGGIIRFAVQGRWRCLTRIHVGPRGMVAVLELPEQYADDLDTYRLHPALLDVVGGSSRVHAAEGYYLPFWYGSLRFVRGLTRRMACHIRIKEGGDTSGETLVCDADVYDDEGRLLVRLGDFIMKRIHEPEAMREQVESAAAAPAPEAPEPAAYRPGGLAALHALAAGMTAEEGTELFGRILRARPMPAQLVVSRQDLATVQRLAAEIDPARLAAELETAAPTTVHPRPELDTPYVAPGTEEEAAIAAIWQETLGVEPVGLNDDFFALGGHSLAAVQIGTRLRAHFGVELTLRDFFDRPTVANTARLLAAGGSDSATAAEEPAPIVRLARYEPAEVTDVDELADDEVDAMLRELLAAEAAVEGETEA